MTADKPDGGTHERAAAWRPWSRNAALLPVSAALAYPYLLCAFHWAITGRPHDLSRAGLVPILLALAFLVPVAGLATLLRLGRLVHPTRFERRARHLALLVIAAPPLFVLFGVVIGLLGSPVRDTSVWLAFWTVALIYGVGATDQPSILSDRKIARWRVAHGGVAAVLSLYVLFHLGNHLTGLQGPAMHARVMNAGRVVYRSGTVEPVLVALLIAQVAIGARLARKWCASTMDLHRCLQVASGAYIGAFVLTHLNSALISARVVRGIPTDWGWASGAPDGLVVDAWNIRLLPHYAFGVFFVLLHLCAGLRVVLLSHGTSLRIADRLWWLGVAGSLCIAAGIVAALCGVRL